ncbi:MAG TPA: prepilin-type N-terminal cleavage/methylation domain-containing protein [Crenotrichaceae bacterium]|nr:prepilin-type N-terminal cleavage/methylation domain-containing protein [Crenotrichaceae bacterium]
MKRFKQQAIQGFTLVEVLIALTLLGVMMTLLMSTFRAGARSWSAGESLASANGNQFVVHNFLRSYLENARPVIDDFSDEAEAEFSFQGDQHNIIFVAGLPANQDRGGLWRFALGLEKNGSSQDLVVLVEPFFPEIDEDAELSETLTLLSNVETFEISYFGKDEVTDQDEDWNDDWEDKTQLPSLIKIDLQVEDQKQWPEIIIATQVEEVADTNSQNGRNNRSLPLSNSRNRLQGKSRLKGKSRNNRSN